MAKEQLVVEVITEAKQAVAELKKYVGEVEKTQSSVGKLTKILKSYWAEAAAAIAATRQITNFLKDCAQQAMESQESIARLNSALKQTGQFSPTASKELQDFAFKLSLTTMYTDETIMGVESLLMTLGGLSKELAMKSTPSVLSLATALKIDVNSAAMLLSKTLGTSTNALSRYIGEIDMTTGASGRLEQIMTIVNTRWGDLNAEIMKTTAGKLSLVSKQFNEIKESIGYMLLEGGEPFLDWLAKLMTSEANFKKITGSIQTFGIVVGASFAFAQKAIETFMAYVYVNTKTIADIFDILGLIATGRFKEAGKVINQIGETWKTFGKDFREGWTDYVQDTIVKFEKAFQLEKPMSILETMRSRVVQTSQAFREQGDAIEKANIQTKDYIKTWDEWQKARFGERSPTEEGGFGIQIDDAIALADAYDKVSTNLDMLAGITVKANEPINEYAIAMARMREEAELTGIMVAGTLANNFADAADAIFTSAKSIKGAIKDMIAGFLQSLGRLLMIQAVLWLLPPFPRIGRAAKYFALGAAAYAGAAVVRSLQQGGTVQNLQGARRMQGGGSVYGDRVPIMAERGETVLSKEVSRNNAASIVAMQAGQRPQIKNVILLNKKVLFEAITEGMDDGQIRANQRSFVK
jgi:hypothetical protein